MLIEHVNVCAKSDTHLGINFSQIISGIIMNGNESLQEQVASCSY